MEHQDHRGPVPSGDASSTPSSPPVQIQWRENRRHVTWDIAGADTKTWGHHRGGYGWLRANGFQSRIAIIPPGQESEWHFSDHDRILIQLEGVIECCVGT